MGIEELVAKFSSALGITMMFGSPGCPTETVEAALGLWEDIVNNSDFSLLPTQVQEQAILAYCGASILLYQRSGEEKRLLMAEEILKSALEHPDLSREATSKFYGNLGNIYYYKRMGGDTAAVEDQVAAFEKALMLIEEDDPDRVSFTANLGIALRERYRLYLSADDLEKAITYLREAVEECSQERRAANLNNLGTCLVQKFLVSSRVAHLKEGISLFRQAVEATLPGDFGLAHRLNNLGGALVLSYNQLLDLGYLREGIFYLQAAIDSVSEESPFLPNLIADLASAYCDLGAGERREEHFHMAIHLSESILQSSNLPSRAMTYYNLGNSYVGLFRLNSSRETLRLAVDAYENSLSDPHISRSEVLMARWNLATAYFERDATEKSSLDWERALEETGYVLREAPLENPRLAIIAARACAHYSQEREDLSEACKAFETCIDLLSNVSAAQLPLDLASSIRPWGNVYGCAAWAFGKSGAVDKAVLTLERGRARELRLLLRSQDTRRAAKIMELAPNLADQLSILDEKLRGLYTQHTRIPGVDDPFRHDSAQSKEIREQASVINRQRRDLVARIQDVEGLEGFEKDLSLEDIGCFVGRGRTVVYLAVSPWGSVAFHLSRDEPGAPLKLQASWADELTYSVVQEYIERLSEAAPSGRASKLDRSETRGWFDAVESLGDEVWSKALGQLLGDYSLASSESIILVPSGLLSLVPLHSIEIGVGSGKTLFDSSSVIYAPTVSVLGTNEEVEVEVTNFLGIQNPERGEEASLPMAEHEVDAVQVWFDTGKVLSGTQCTREAVSKELSRADVVHFACHGHHDWNLPMRSGLLLAGEDELPVSELLTKRHRDRRLAVVAACWSGQLDPGLPDETLGLTTALICSGFRQVVAAFYPVADLGSAILMERFYRFWQEDGLSPESALRSAQLWIRDTSNAEKIAYYDSVIGQDLPEQVCRVLVIFRGILADRSPKECLFEHPSYWAPFFIVGGHFG